MLWLKHTVKRILCDQYLQQWNSEKCNSSRGINYRMFKHDFKLENYLLKLSTKNARILCKFRTGNVKLPIETGRWFNIERDDRICHLCNSDVGDEFHYIFNCTSLSAERNEYIPSYYRNRASAFSFFIYSLPPKKSLLCKLCKYLQIVIEGPSSGLIFIVYYVKNHYRKHFVNQFCLYFLHTALTPCINWVLTSLGYTAPQNNT